jgi:hypothetical protein
MHIRRTHLPYDHTAYGRRRRYADLHGLAATCPAGRYPASARPAPVWQLPANAEAAIPACTVDGPALACCNQWHAVTQTPLVVPCCGRVWLEGTPQEVPA